MAVIIFALIDTVEKQPVIGDIIQGDFLGQMFIHGGHIHQLAVIERQVAQGFQQFRGFFPDDGNDHELDLMALDEVRQSVGGAQHRNPSQTQAGFLGVVVQKTDEFQAAVRPVLNRLDNPPAGVPGPDDEHPAP